MKRKNKIRNSTELFGNKYFLWRLKTMLHIDHGQEANKMNLVPVDVASIEEPRP